MDLQTRQQYMKAMGIPVWMPRAPRHATDDLTESAELSPTELSQTAQPALQITQPLPPAAKPAESQPSPARAMTELLDQQPRTVAKTAPPLSPIVVHNIPDCSAMNWTELHQQVTGCQLCGLSTSRTHTVFGTGDQHADWMIVGEAPGAEEDRQGQPFVGRAGKLLNNMLAAVGLPREAVYISNVLKCRPPNNRDPQADEAALCRGYLERQIALLKPRVIIVVGRIAAHNLLQVKTPLGRLRGTVHTLPGADIPVIVTYHPAYLLRQPAEKRKSWQDLQLARQTMAQYR